MSLATRALGALSALSLLLAPILIWQGRRVRRDTLRLPEAAGARHGRVAGRAPPFEVLVIGDSTAAGVGAEVQDNALAAQTARALRERTGRAAAWHVEGRNGRRVGGARRALASLPADVRATVVVVCIGVNDVTALTSARAFRTGIEALADELAARFEGASLLFSGLPPMHTFPALPAPLRQVMGLRARYLDRLLADAVAGRANAQFVPLTFAHDLSLFAPDGFHPGIPGYRQWAQALAGRVVT